MKKNSFVYNINFFIICCNKQMTNFFLTIIDIIQILKKVWPVNEGEGIIFMLKI
jgi:hypothetical protein